MTTPATSTFIQFNGFNNHPLLVRPEIIMAVSQHHDSTKADPISVLIVQFGNGDGNWTVRESVKSVLAKLCRSQKT